MAKRKTPPPAPPTDPTPTWTPRPFAGLRCHCGERHHQTAAYYVTVRRDDGDARALVGPFAEHDEALAYVDRTHRLAETLDPRAVWYAFGTAAMKWGYRKPGMLNDRLGLVA